jgi:hypothetical protein
VLGRVWELLFLINTMPDNVAIMPTMVNIIPKVMVVFGVFMDKFNRY